MSILKYYKPFITNDIWRFEFDNVSGKILTSFLKHKGKKTSFQKIFTLMRLRDLSGLDCNSPGALTHFQKRIASFHRLPSPRSLFAEGIGSWRAIRDSVTSCNKDV